MVQLCFLTYAIAMIVKYHDIRRWESSSINHDTIVVYSSMYHSAFVRVVISPFAFHSYISNQKRLFTINEDHMKFYSNLRNLWVFVILRKCWHFIEEQNLCEHLLSPTEQWRILTWHMYLRWPSSTILNFNICESIF